MSCCEAALSVAAAIYLQGSQAGGALQEHPECLAWHAATCSTYLYSMSV